MLEENYVIVKSDAFKYALETGHCFEVRNGWAHVHLDDIDQPHEFEEDELKPLEDATFAERLGIMPENEESGDDLNEQLKKLQSVAEQLQMNEAARAIESLTEHDEDVVNEILEDAARSTQNMSQRADEYMTESNKEDGHTSYWIEDNTTDDS